MGKKKVGVITFHNYDNYGAILQSFALQKRIRESGYDSEIIDYRCDYISNPFKLVNLRKKGLFNYIYGVIGHICYIPRRRKCNQFRKHMKYSEPVRKGNMCAVEERYDMYVAGSDQIWDYKLTNSDTTYFLDFVKKGKKYSYAASIGENPPPESIRGAYAELLGKFDHILVRESYGAKIVENMTGNMPECVCDPTLLLNAEEWSRYLKPVRSKKKYILVYQLGINREVVEFTKKLAKKTGYKVVYIPFPLVGLLKCSCKIAIGPAEWMGLFQGAEYVVSDSFHGIVFSLLFNKPFFTMTNGHHVNRRVEELLQKVKISGRTIQEMTDETILDPIDFTFANQKLEMIRKESMKALQNMLSMGE